jgi:hypothetical protein
MFPQHIVSDILQDLDIVHHRLIRGRSIQSIWPIPLIERTEWKDRLAIQHHSLHAIDGVSSDGPETSVAADLLAAAFDHHIVQVGFTWAPKLG